MIGGGDLFYLKLWVKVTANFLSIFARSVSAEQLAKIVQLTLIYIYY